MTMILIFNPFFPILLITLVIISLPCRHTHNIFRIWLDKKQQQQQIVCVWWEQHVMAQIKIGNFRLFLCAQNIIKPNFFHRITLARTASYKSHTYLSFSSTSRLLHNKFFFYHSNIICEHMLRSHRSLTRLFLL